jgi:N utilization substance protein B
MPLTRIEQRARRRARARVLQAVYAWDLARSGSLRAVADRLWADLSLGAEEREFATPLIETLAARAVEIDAALTEVTAHWRLERIGTIERAVLRLATAELLRAEVPPRVTLQEAVQLAERFGAPESARFVNGVLDAVARRLRSV